MLNKIDKKLCNGCSACASICPKKCIQMVNDKNGFLYPLIDQKECINCNACVKACAVLTPNKLNEYEQIAYAVINKSEQVRKDSSSGGVFNEIAKKVLQDGGVVFGASLNENFEVEHIYVDSLDNLYKLRKSKYVQSKIGNSYIKTKEFLEQGKKVLFTGTPCQIGGLKKFLNKHYDNLITQDIICHGVPSPKVWKKYFQSKSNGKTISNVSFRDKKFGWKKYCIKFSHDKGESYSVHRQDSFMKVFLKDLSLRLSCYNCSFKSHKRQSDITLADYWGVEKIHPEMFDDLGTSLVFINTKKGNDLFMSVSDEFDYIQTDLTKAIEQNPAMIRSVQMNKKRDKFFAKLDSADFEKLANKFTCPPLIKRVKGKVKNIIKKITC